MSPSRNPEPSLSPPRFHWGSDPASEVPIQTLILDYFTNWQSTIFSPFKELGSFDLSLPLLFALLSSIASPLISLYLTVYTSKYEIINEEQALLTFLPGKAMPI